VSFVSLSLSKFVCCLMWRDVQLSGVGLVGVGARAPPPNTAVLNDGSIVVDCCIPSLSNDMVKTIAKD
jgi:hypothetical protein